MKFVASFLVIVALSLPLQVSFHPHLSCPTDTENESEPVCC